MDGPPAAGRVRTCQVAGFGPLRAAVIKERLIEFEPEARSLSYQAAAGMPWFIVGALSRWSVHAGPGSASTVRVHASLALHRAARPLTPVLRWRMRADTRRALAELRYRVETGRPAQATPGLAAAEEVPRAAWVIRQPLTIVRANTGAEALCPGVTQLTPDQLIDLWYGPGPFSKTRS
jgi:hypothetical protein